MLYVPVHTQGLLVLVKKWQAQQREYSADERDLLMNRTAMLGQLGNEDVELLISATGFNLNFG